VPLILGVLPRKTPARLTRPSNPPDHISFLSLGGRATATAKSKAKEFGLMLWLYSLPLILLLPNPSEDE